jgi:hypothetical protein
MRQRSYARLTTSPTSVCSRTVESQYVVGSLLPSSHSIGSRSTGGARFVHRHGTRDWQ